MDPNPSPRKMRILSYVMTRIPSFKRRQLQELENENERLLRPSALPETYTELSQRESYTELAERVSHLTEDDILANIRAVVVEVSQIRSVIQTLGERPDPETVSLARSRYAEAESPFAVQFDGITLSEQEMEVVEKRRRAAKREMQMYRALISLDEMHETYSKLLVVAERRLRKLYDTAKEAGKLTAVDKKVSSMLPTITEEVKEEMGDILHDALTNGVERIDLSYRQLPFVPEAFGKLRTLVSLNLSANKLMALPDSLAGLQSLQELNVSTNLFESLPNAIGSLQQLQLLDVSSNKLSSLPDGICKCRSLVEFDGSLNQIKHLPTNIGWELVNLKKLLMPLNKLRSLPTSIGEMKSLEILDVHFNELKGLPSSIGKLTKLEVLNVSSNFNDLTCLPDTVGDLTNLRELDICNNQVQQLPITFGRLVNLTRFSVEQNPLVVPPQEVVEEGVEAVKVYMSKKLYDKIVEEEKMMMLEREEQAETSWFMSLFFGPVSGPGSTYPYLTHRL